jgi:hypothetical protein
MWGDGGAKRRREFNHRVPTWAGLGKLGWRLNKIPNFRKLEMFSHISCVEYRVYCISGLFKNSSTGEAAKYILDRCCSVS